MSKPSAEQLRQLRRDNAKWPDALASVPSDQWPIPPFEEKSIRLAVWRSRRFLMQMFKDEGGGTRLSVNRTEWDEKTSRFRDDVSWDDLQRLKAEAGFADAWACEFFPADDAVVNVANMRHIWLMQAPSWAWNSPNRLARAA